MDKNQWQNPYDVDESGSEAEVDNAEPDQQSNGQRGNRQQVDTPDIDFDQVRKTKLSDFSKNGDSQ